MKKTCEKPVKKDLHISIITLQTHLVNLKFNFVFACFYSFLNIYYKYTIFQFSIPLLLIKNPLSPSLTRYPGNFDPTLLLRPPIYLTPKSSCTKMNGVKIIREL